MIQTGTFCAVDEYNNSVDAYFPPSSRSIYVKIVWKAKKLVINLDRVRRRCPHIWILSAAGYLAGTRHPMLVVALEGNPEADGLRKHSTSLLTHMEKCLLSLWARKMILSDEPCSWPFFIIRDAAGRVYEFW